MTSVWLTKVLTKTRRIFGKQNHQLYIVPCHAKYDVYCYNFNWWNYSFETIKTLVMNLSIFLNTYDSGAIMYNFDDNF